MNWKFWKKRPTDKRLDVPEMFLNDGRYKIVEAFEFKGVMYYQFDSALKLPADRAFSALTMYEEMNQRCTREYLEDHCKAVDSLINNKQIGVNELMKLATLHNNLKERLNLAPHPDFIYKYASVIFFDPTESPYLYDPVYNQKKIELWKTDPKLLDFFLTLPVLNLIPHLGMSVVHFKMYSEFADVIRDKHRNDLQAVLSSNS